MTEIVQKLDYFGLFLRPTGIDLQTHDISKIVAKVEDTETLTAFILKSIMFLQTEETYEEV